jgi:hypothetical protein
MLNSSDLQGPVCSHIRNTLQGIAPSDERVKFSDVVSFFIKNLAIARNASQAERVIIPLLGKYIDLGWMREILCHTTAVFEVYKQHMDLSFLPAVSRPCSHFALV